MDSDPKARRDAPARHASAASPWEWAVGAVGLALIAAAIGYLVYAALTTPVGPPQIRLAADAVERSSDGYVVLVTVANGGPSTAAALEIEGTLEGDGRVVETSTASLDYLPRFSTRVIGLYFGKDPDDHRLRLRPLGYAEP
jgi:uncharacterized protein (TIGR02588 family)